jgi:hypothetical protein
MPDLTASPAAPDGTSAGRGFPLWAGGLALAVVLIVSLALKGTEGVRAVADLVRRDNPAVTRFLEQNGFRVVSEPDSHYGWRVIGSGRLGCQVMMIQAKSQGWDQFSLRQFAQPGDDFFVVYEGALYDAHPTWRIKFDGYVDRVLRHIGMARPERPVFAVMASPTCTVRGLPWRNLSAPLP